MSKVSGASLGFGTCYGSHCSEKRGFFQVYGCGLFAAWYLCSRVVFEGNTGSRLLSKTPHISSKLRSLCGILWTHPQNEQFPQDGHSPLGKRLPFPARDVFDLIFIFVHLYNQVLFGTFDFYLSLYVRRGSRWVPGVLTSHGHRRRRRRRRGARRKTRRVRGGGCWERQLPCWPGTQGVGVGYSGAQQGPRTFRPPTLGAL